MNELIDFRNKLYEMKNNFEYLELQGRTHVKIDQLIRLIGRMIRYIDRRIEDRCVDRTMEDW